MVDHGQHSLIGHSVVDADSASSKTTMSLDGDEPLFFGLLDEFGLERLVVVHSENDVSVRAAWLLDVVRVESAVVNKVVNGVALLGRHFLIVLESLFLHVGDVESAYVDWPGGRGVVELCGGFYLDLPVHHQGAGGSGSLDQVFPDHNYGYSRRTDVLLDPTVYHSVFIPLNRLGAKVR